MRRLRRRAVTAGVIVLSMALSLTATSAHAQTDNSVSVQEISAAMKRVRGLLVPSVASSYDADSLAETDAVDVRTNGTLHIKTADASDIVITIPYANQVQGVRANDNVAFPGKKASGVYVRPATGGAQVALVAVNRSAPTNYPFHVSNGSVAKGPHGSLLLFDSKQRLNRIVPAPWARDATGKMVSTQYNVRANGTTFSQEVMHRTDDVAYPVVADPHITPYSNGAVITFNRDETGIIGASIALSPVWAARLMVVGTVANQLTWNIWRIQAAAAWESLHGKCLWLWVPISGGIETGGFSC